MNHPWHYTVAMPQPQNHLFEIQLEIQLNSQAELNLKLPVWSPGSYLVREYAKHLQNFEVKDRNGNPLPWQKTSKNQWQIQTAKVETLYVSYQIFANELTVRTNHLDRSHGYFNGAAMFMYSEEYADGFEVEIRLPDSDWQIATALSKLSDRPNTFFAEDFDTLVDSPFEIGIHQRYDFMVLGKVHAWVIWGEGNLEIEQLIEDTTAIIQTEAKMFGGLPYENYLFILHLSANGYGGLEHRNCCSLIYPRLGFRHEAYLRFLNLVAHEFFHTWNVKRLKPIELAKFDYDRENYTNSLWFAEGVTSYYDQLILLRAGLCDRDRYLKQVSESITKLQLTPGRKVQSLAESSFDTWIKLYRPDPNSANSQVSYYLKGELVAMLLDLTIRANGKNSLDTVMELLWRGFGDRGFSQADLLQRIESIAGLDLSAFWQDYLFGTKELDYNFYFVPFGLTLQTLENSTSSFYTGMTVGNGGGLGVVKYIANDSPAQNAGINVGDEILAIDGIKVTADQFSDRLKLYNYGDRITLTLFQQDLLCTTQMELLPPLGDRFVLRENTELSSTQAHNLKAWLGS
jgi:predicted metalloprotease with PDZ domain